MTQQAMNNPAGLLAANQRQVGATQFNAHAQYLRLEACRLALATPGVPDGEAALALAVKYHAFICGEGDGGATA